MTEYSSFCSSFCSSENVLSSPSFWNNPGRRTVCFSSLFRSSPGCIWMLVYRSVYGVWVYVHGSKAPPLTSPREFSATAPERTIPPKLCVPTFRNHPWTCTCLLALALPRAPGVAAHTCVQLTMSLLGLPIALSTSVGDFITGTMLSASRVPFPQLRAAHCFTASYSATSPKHTFLQTAQSSPWFLLFSCEH